MHLDWSNIINSIFVVSVVADRLKSREFEVIEMRHLADNVWFVDFHLAVINIIPENRKAKEMADEMDGLSEAAVEELVVNTMLATNNCCSHFMQICNCVWLAIAANE